MRHYHQINHSYGHSPLHDGLNTLSVLTSVKPYWQIEEPQYSPIPQYLQAVWLLLPLVYGDLQYFSVLHVSVGWKRKQLNHISENNWQRIYNLTEYCFGNILFWYLS